MPPGTTPRGLPNENGTRILRIQPIAADFIRLDLPDRLNLWSIYITSRGRYRSASAKCCV